MARGKNVSRSRRLIEPCPHCGAAALSACTGARGLPKPVCRIPGKRGRPKALPAPEPKLTSRGRQLSAEIQRRGYGCIYD